MQKVLINLDRSTERLETFYRVNKHIKDVERFSAIEGKGLRQPLKQSGLLLEGVDYSDGALGCALSHAEQWRRAVSSGEALTVIEDDAVFCKNFEEEHKRLLKTLPETWDIILWGYSFYSPIAYDLLPQFSSCITFVNYLNLREDIALYKEVSIEGDLFRLVQTCGLFCYSVSPKGAKKFLEFCFPIRPIDVLHPDYKHVHSKNISIPGYSRPIKNYGIDIAMAALYPELEAYACVPPLVFATKDEMTTETTSDV